MGTSTTVRFEVVAVFVVSLLAGVWSAWREGGRERVRRNVFTNLVSTVGLLVGYRLATRRRRGR